MLKDLHLESRNIEAQKIFSPNQCTVWPRNVKVAQNLLYLRLFLALKDKKE